MTFESSILALSPTSYWKMDEASGSVIADDSGSPPFDGTKIGGTLGVPGLITGEAATALEVSGGGQYVSGDETLNIGPGQPYTWLVVAKDLDGATGSATLFGIAPSFAHPEWNMRILATSDSGQTRFGYEFNDGGVVSPVVGGLFDPGAPHLLVLTFDGTAYQFYIDGTLADSGSSAGPDITDGVYYAGRNCSDFVLQHAAFIESHLSSGQVSALAAPVGGGGGGGGGGGVATCIAVELGGFVFDGVTEDGDGIVYDWQDLAGWWDSPDLATVVEQNAFGVTETVVNVGGRSITLTGVAHFPTRGTVLGDLAPKAMRTVKRACGAMFASKILRVDESDLILQARVRQSGPMRFKLGSNRVSVTFQIPLLAPDPRRYDATPQTVATSSSFSATNNGDLPTPPVLTVEGPATDVSLRNSTLENTPFVRFNGSLAGGAVLTIDFANLTADVDGLNVLSLLDGNQGGLPDAGGIGGGPPAWFQLAPGANALHQGGGGTGTIDFADAYQ